MNWATNFLRAKCATTGTRCKTVVILSMRHCFTGKNGELELRNYKGRAFPFFAQKFVGYSAPGPFYVLPVGSGSRGYLSPAISRWN